MTYREKMETIIRENFPNINIGIAHTFASRHCPCEFFGKEVEVYCGKLDNCRDCWEQEIKEYEE